MGNIYVFGLNLCTVFARTWSGYGRC